MISLKRFQEFPDAVFLGVYVELLLGEAEVSALHIEFRFGKGITFDLTVQTPSNF
jgi:hypothetical protein